MGFLWVLRFPPPSNMNVRLILQSVSLTKALAKIWSWPLERVDMLATAPSGWVECTVSNSSCCKLFDMYNQIKILLLSCSGMLKHVRNLHILWVSSMGVAKWLACSP